MPVYEDGQTLGHAESVDSRYMFETPFLSWMSAAYRAERPGFCEELSAYTDRPWQADDLIYPLLQLGGISFDGMSESKDILSEKFIPEKRLLNGKDYDQMFLGNEPGEQGR